MNFYPDDYNSFLQKTSLNFSEAASLIFPEEIVAILMNSTPIYSENYLCPNNETLNGFTVTYNIFSSIQNVISRDRPPFILFPMQFSCSLIFTPHFRHLGNALPHFSSYISTKIRSFLISSHMPCRLSVFISMIAQVIDNLEIQITWLYSTLMVGLLSLIHIHDHKRLAAPSHFSNPSKHPNTPRFHTFICTIPFSIFTCQPSSRAISQIPCILPKKTK